MPNDSTSPRPMPARIARYARRSIVIGIFLSVATVSAAFAQDSAESPEVSAARVKFRSIQWIEGPATGALGSVAQLEVPSECRFTEAAGARTFLHLVHDIPSGREVGLVYCSDRKAQTSSWFVIFSYDASGYVRDDEKSSLDADAILASIRSGTEESNKERRSRGWEEMSVLGWVVPPHYDQRTHNLTWSLSGKSSAGDTSVNQSVRLLGRGGVLRVELVLDPSQLATVVPSFDSIIAGTSFVPGSRYAEWRDGDKVAAYGLTALIAGGAGAVAMKTGLFGRLGRVLIALGAALWKMLAAAVVGLWAMLKAVFGRRPKGSSTPDEGAAP
jgi:uncharacterized membrane-anchored protein